MTGSLRSLLIPGPFKRFIMLFANILHTVEGMQTSPEPGESVHGESRPAERPRRVLPLPGAQRRAHARGLRAGLGRRSAGLRRLRGQDRAAAAPRPALPAEARLAAARPEPARLDRRPPLQRPLPRAPH